MIFEGVIVEMSSIQNCAVQTYVKFGLTLPFPSLLVPTPFTKGGGGGSSRPPPPAISKTVAPMNMKFCRVLETPLKVLEMFKLFLGYHSNPSKERCFGEIIARFQPKIPIIKIATKLTIFKITF